MNVLRGLDPRYRDIREDIEKDFSENNLAKVTFEMVIEQLHAFRKRRKIKDEDEAGGGKSGGGRKILALEVIDNLPISRKE